MDTAWTIDALIERLQAPDQFTRIHAATLLGSLGEDAEAAVPALIYMLENGDVQNRRLAALTLGEVGPVAEEAIPALLEAADDEDEGVSELAIEVEAVGRIDQDEIEAEAA